MYVILEEVGDYYKYNELYNSLVYTELDYVTKLVEQLNIKYKTTKFSWKELTVCKEKYKDPEVIKEQIKAKLTEEESYYLDYLIGCVTNNLDNYKL